LETPALRVTHELDPKKSELINRITRDDWYELDKSGKKTQKLIIAEDRYIDEKAAELLEKHY